MKEKRLFLQWAVMAILIAVGALFAFRLGYGTYLEEEPTRVTYVTLAIFALGSALCGRLCWKLCGDYRPNRVRKGLKWARYSAHLCVYMGLFGTGLGYYIMLKSGGADLEPKEAIKAGFGSTSIAIVNTIVGIGTSILLQLQSHYTQVEFEYLEDEKDDAEDAPAAAPAPEGGAP